MKARSCIFALCSGADHGAVKVRQSSLDRISSAGTFFCNFIWAAEAAVAIVCERLASVKARNGIWASWI